MTKTVIYSKITVITNQGGKTPWSLYTLTLDDNTETPLQEDKPLVFKREGNVLKLVHQKANFGQDVEYVMNAGLESMLAGVNVEGYNGQ